MSGRCVAATGLAIVTCVAAGGVAAGGVAAWGVDAGVAEGCVPGFGVRVVAGR